MTSGVRYNRDIESTHLSPEAFQNALYKGQGRAFAALRNAKPGEYDRIIVESFLHDQQDNRYFEALRFPYQMRLIELAGIEDRVLDEVLQRLPDTVSWSDRDWMLAMLGGFAQCGNGAAYRIVQEQAWAGNDWAQQILAHTGEVGLGWLIDNVLPGLLERDLTPVYQWHRRDEFHEETPARRRLRVILDGQEEDRDEPEDAPESPILTPRQYLDHVKATGSPPDARSHFREEATDDEYRELVELWLGDPTGPLYSKVWRVLPCRPFPLPFERLFSPYEDRQIQFYLDRVLRDMPHPEVRTYALRRLEDRPVAFNSVGLLKGGLQAGDEASIRAVLPQILLQDETSRFGFIYGLLDLMEEHEGVDWQPFAEWVYEHAEDSSQRREAVEWMAESGTLPAAIREEGVDDAEPTIQRICRSKYRNLVAA